ncbi:hypothetical protein VTK56DRAFT_8557 [Thermocarpiscus australiensis]
MSDQTKGQDSQAPTQHSLRRAPRTFEEMGIPHGKEMPEPKSAWASAIQSVKLARKLTQKFRTGTSDRPLLNR